MNEGYVLVADDVGQWNVFEARRFWRECNSGNYIGRRLVSLGKGLVTIPVHSWTHTIHPNCLSMRSPGHYEVEERHVLKRIDTESEALALVEQIRSMTGELDKARQNFSLMLKLV